MGRLSLTRRIGQKIVLDTPAGAITVEISRIRDSERATLTIDAPASVRVDREEIRDARQGGRG